MPSKKNKAGGNSSHAAPRKKPVPASRRPKTGQIPQPDPLDIFIITMRLSTPGINKPSSRDIAKAWEEAGNGPIAHSTITRRVKKFGDMEVVETFRMGLATLSGHVMEAYRDGLVNPKDGHDRASARRDLAFGLGALRQSTDVDVTTAGAPIAGPQGIIDAVRKLDTGSIRKLMEDLRRSSGGTDANG